MRKRPVFSGEHLTVSSIETHRAQARAMADLYYSESNPEFLTIFVAQTRQEMPAGKLKFMKEQDNRAMLALLGTLEAAFRIDYAYRCSTKKRDEVSKSFRAAYQNVRDKASLDQDIFQTWKDNSDANEIIASVRSAFHLRNWLAHGRYFKPKHQAYDYELVRDIVIGAISAFPLLPGDDYIA